ncbi:biotin--[acetyl-CoA-carboxylase] ligase [Nesterenkonia sp.]|uniref:biotin--[acetyl-CoA-carboxylase] ligase n=1 Tax=Nesterenkonia sp. TaxID=704201 RepID=UPI00262EDFF6|nr:biotin--[acetyl-CoA-carboxylase] ligase [Nesterenkonia sp.]
MNAPTPRLDAEVLRHRLVDTEALARLEVVQSTASTNADLLQQAEDRGFAEAWPQISVLTAEEQTGGKGRLGRSWSSPPGTSLSTSLVLQPRLPSGQRAWLPLLTGLALVRALSRRGIAAELKWPNDVCVSGRKVAGILAAVPPLHPQCLIIGCGINVLQTREQLPTPEATSVLLQIQQTDAAAERPQAADAPDPDAAVLGSTEAAGLRTALLGDWLQEVAALLQRAEDAGGVDPLRDEAVAALGTIGRQVRLELPDGTAVRGRASGLETDGSLQLEVTARRRHVLGPEDGGGPESLWEPVEAHRRSFSAGDVVHLRPAG